MNYERITPEDLVEAINMPQGEDMTRILRYVHRLWELENAIERGELVNASPAGKMTNREYLNSLSDEEFARTLRFGFLCYRCDNGTKRGNCKIKSHDTELCDAGIVAWLKKEYDGSADLK